MFSSWRYLIILFALLFTFLPARLLETTTANWSIIPGSYPVVFSAYKSNPAGNSNSALRITTQHQENYAILKYQLPAMAQNAASYNYLVFDIKADSLTELEIALEDNNKTSSFEKINNYLPKKKLTADWQKVKYPLRPELLNTNFIKNIYLKIISDPRNKREIIYLDNLSFLALDTEKTTNNVGFKIHNFDNGLKNSFNAEPQTQFYLPAQIDLSTVKQNHYGSTGASLAVKFNTMQGARSSLFVPVLNRGQSFDAAAFNKISMQLRVIPPQSITIRPLYTKIKTHQEKHYPLKTKETEITPPDPFWHKISLELNEQLKTELAGLYIYFAKNRRGILYLDEIYLE